jgi:hypothetical protein
MVAQTKVSESGVALDNTNSAAVKLAFQEVYKSYDVGTNENSVTQFKTYLDNITDLILGDSGITSNKGNIFEINDKIQELMHDFNSETFKERINFINSVYAMVMPWTSLVLNSMLFDAIRNEDLALAYELEVSNLDNLISSGSLRDDDMFKIKDTKKQFEFYAADARLLADTSNRNVQTLENRTAKITLARGESLRKVYKEMTQFYDVNKPSVYNYRLKRYFVPFVFNSLAYPGIDNSIAVSAADMMGNTNDKNNSLIKPNSGWHLDMKQIESWCFSYDPNDREKCRSVESGDAGLWKENNPYNPSVYYMPDKTLKNTFSKHIFSNTLEANKGLRGDKFYNKTVVSAEDLKTIKHYAAASNIDKPLHDASFQFMSLDTATNGFKNQCDNYLGGNNDTNCFLNASTIGPVQAAPVEASMYYSNVDTPQKLDAGLYTGVDSQYKSLGWVTSENQANLAETNLWPSEKSDHRQTSAPRFVDKLNIWHKFVTKSDKYINNAIQKVNTLDSKLNWQTNQTIAQIYTGQDVFNNDNLTTYNQCKDNNDNNKKCIRYFNNQTVNWLEYRNTDEVPSVDEAKIDLSIVPSSKQLDKTIDKDVSKITNGNIFDYYNTYYGTATNSITYYQGLLQLVKERTLNAKNHPNSYEQAELGYWRNVHTCTDYFLFISCEDSKQWVKTGTTPAFTWGTTIDYMSNGLYAFGAFSDDGKYTIDGQIYINPVKYNGHTYKKSQIRDFISEYLKAKFNLPSGGYITPDQVIKQIDGDLSNEAFFLQWSPNDYTKAFYDAYKNIPKMSGNARSMIVYGAKQVSDYLGTDGFNYLQSGKTLSTYIGDAAASSVVNKIFATFFQAMIGEGWGPNIMTYAGIGVQPIQFQLYPGWKALGLTRSDFGLKGFWVRGERIDGKPGTVKYHAEGYTGFSPLTIDLSSIKVRPMIKASGDANWSWGGQTQRTAPFAYDFLVWTGLNETIEYNMMVKVCGLEYTSDAWICKDTYTRSTYPSK